MSVNNKDLNIEDNVLYDEEKTPKSQFGLLKTKPLSGKTFSTIITFFVVFAVYFVFSIFFFSVVLMPLTVLGYSMHPTLNSAASGNNGDINTDIVYIKKTSTNIKVHDIIVFDATKVGYENDYFIKRVVAKEGDTVQFVTSSQATETNHFLKFSLYRNGQLIDESGYASEMLMEVGFPQRNYIAKSDIYKSIITEEILTVPAGFVFVMGDNRAHSTDSREFGFVETSQIIGKVKIHVEHKKNIIFAIFHSIKENYLFN